MCLYCFATLIFVNITVPAKLYFHYKCTTFFFIVNVRHKSQVRDEQIKTLHLDEHRHNIMTT